MLETAIAQKATFSSTPLDRLPSKPELNPKEQCNAMILLGGEQLEGPKEITSNKSSQDMNEHVEKGEKRISLPSKEITDDVTPKPDEVPKDAKTISPEPYIPPLRFPQRMAKAKLDKQFGNFLDILEKLYINIPFAQTLT